MLLLSRGWWNAERSLAARISTTVIQLMDEVRVLDRRSEALLTIKKQQMKAAKESDEDA